MDQCVRRRKNRPLVSFSKIKTQTAHKPYKYIDEVRQNPVRIKRPRQRRQFRFPGIPVQETRFPKSAQTPEQVPKQTPAENTGERKPLFPVFTWLEKPFWKSPAPVCMLVGIAAFSAFILGFQSTPVMALSPGDGPAAAMRANLAAYAIPEIAGPALEAGDPIPLDLMETFQWESYRVQKGDSVSKIAADRSISLDAIIASNEISNARRLREGDVLRIPNMDGIPYTVKRGDSLARISAAMGAPLDAILDANDLQSDTLNAGQTLFIPGARMPKEDLKLALGELFVYPIRGRLTSSYGWRNDPINGARRYHAALDLAAPMGTAIKAAMDGRVATVGF
jgi:LysM repeat protein